jgi:hypothetical protein
MLDRALFYVTVASNSQHIEKGKTMLSKLRTLLALIFQVLRSKEPILTLTLDGNKYTFACSRDFRRARRSCTFEADKLCEYQDWKSEEIADSVEKARIIQAQVKLLIEEQRRGRHPSGSLLGRLDERTISQDHDWRAIIVTLRGLSNKYETYQAIALDLYGEYIVSRVKAMEMLSILKNENGGYNHGETSIIPSPLLPSRNTDQKERVLVTGQTYRVKVPAEGIPLTLAGFDDYRIFRSGGSLVFTGPETKNFLVLGENNIGRAGNGNVLLERARTAISRRHLRVTTTKGTRSVWITDLSTLGTKIPEDLIF